MPFANNFVRKSESPFAIAVHKKLPAFSMFNEAPSFVSKEETRSCPFLMASSKGVFPKVSRKTNKFLLSNYWVAD